MDEKEIQATMDRLIQAWMDGKQAGAFLEIFKLTSDTLVKLTRLVEAVECIASCHVDLVDGTDPTLETVQTEGTC